MSMQPDQRPGFSNLPELNLIEVRYLAEDTRVCVYESPATAMAIETVRKLTLVDNPTVLLATGRTMLPYYRELLALTQVNPIFGTILRRTTFGQIDNYVYHPSAYPNGPDDTDFTQQLIQQFIGPLELPEGRFIPLNGYTDTPEAIAEEYAKTFTERPPTIVNFGLGPLPEVHIGYMREGTPFDTDVHHIPHLSEGVIARNRNRGENPPTEAITIGHKTYENAHYIQVLCFGAEKAESLDRALYAELSPQIVATGLRRPGLGNVEYFVDRAAFAIAAKRS